MVLRQLLEYYRLNLKEVLKLYLKELKRIFYSKKSIFSIISITFLYFIVYSLMKNNYYYEVINYIPKYLNYYIENYLEGNISSLIYNGQLWFFVENSVSGIFSSIFIYFASFQSVIFDILIFVTPILLFYLIFDNLYYEIHTGFFKNIIIKIGKKKYLINKFLSLITFGGLFMVLPKLIYYLFLNLAFINKTTNHYINNSNFIMEKYLFIKQNYSPNDLLLSDLGLSFIYGIIITIIAIIVIILCNKSIYCYVSFILVIICNAVLSIVFSNISIPIIFLYSICECIDFNYKLAQPISLLIHISVILTSLLILLNITINKRIDDYV